MIPVIAGVAVFTDKPSAALLNALPGLELDPAAVRAVLADPDPVEAGIAAAVQEAAALLTVPGVAGVRCPDWARPAVTSTPRRSKRSKPTGSGKSTAHDRQRPDGRRVRHRGRMDG